MNLSHKDEQYLINHPNIDYYQLQYEFRERYSISEIQDCCKKNNIELKNVYGNSNMTLDLLYEYKTSDNEQYHLLKKLAQRNDLNILVFGRFGQTTITTALWNEKTCEKENQYTTLSVDNIFEYYRDIKTSKGTIAGIKSLKYIFNDLVVMEESRPEDFFGNSIETFAQNIDVFIEVGKDNDNRLVIFGIYKLKNDISSKSQLLLANSEIFEEYK